MSRFREIEYLYDGHTLLIGDVALLPNGQLEFDGFNVVVYIGGIDYDVTKAFSERQLAGFKQSFELHVFDKYAEDLKADYRDRLDDWNEGA